MAEKFGAEGFVVALVARSADKLAQGVKSLAAKGIKAAGFPADLGDPEAVRALVAKVRAELGPVTVVHWNAYAGDAGDLLVAKPEELRRAFDVAVTGLLTAVQASLPDMKAQKDAAVLVTNGGFGLVDPKVDAFGVQANAMGLSVANAAKHKMVGLLAHKLKGDGIYVGEVMVLGIIKGTAWDRGEATLEASTVANKFWELYQAKTEIRARLG
jgi:short-subunit dehydrogenase